MIALALLAFTTAEPPKEKGVSGVVAEVTASSVTLHTGEWRRVTEGTQYLPGTGRDPTVVGSGELAKGTEVRLAVVEGVAVRFDVGRVVADDPLDKLAPHAS